MPRCDALQACRRRVGDPSHFAQYVVGLDEKTGFKSVAPKWRDPSYKYELPRVYRAFDNEANLLAIASSYRNPSTPRLLAYNKRTHVIKMQHLGDYTSLKSLGLNVDFTENRQISGRFLNAVEQLHIAGIVHTDMHTGNVMVHKVTGDVKLIDLNTGIGVNWGRDFTKLMDVAKREMSGADALEAEIKKLWTRMGIPTGNAANALMRKHIKGIRQVGALNARQREDMIRNFYGDFRQMLLNPSTFAKPMPTQLVTTPSQDLAAAEALASLTKKGRLRSPVTDRVV